jgi:hypothetical protein
MNVSALLLEIPRQFNAHYTANLVSNRAHGLPFTLCELWCRTYTMFLQLRILRLQYSTEGICAATADISTMLRALNCKPGTKWSAHPPVYPMWTVVPDIYNVITAQRIQSSIFNCRYLRCYCRYLDNATRVKLQTRNQMKRTSASLRCVSCGLGYLRSIYSSAYLGFNIQL